MLIKNGLIMNPRTNETLNADIRVLDGVIKEIGTLTAEANEEVLDIHGLIIAPGLIDTHIHFRDPGFTYKEDIHTGALASAKGGFTSVICMANTKPIVDSVETLQDILKRAKNEKIRIYQAVAVTPGFKGEELTNMEELANAGACGFTDDGIPITDAKICFEAMKKAAELDLPISLHEEDPAFIAQNGINHGIASEALGIYGSPSIAEESMVARDCMLALQSGADVVIQHISSGNSVQLVRNAKAMGAKIHAEATPHHFTLTDEAVLKYGSLAKMNPPLREEKDRLAIIEGLKDNTIDLIATDHAPHSAEEKSKGLAGSMMGVVGIETSFPVCYTHLVKKNIISLCDLMKLMNENPSKRFSKLNEIKKGEECDLCIFDLEKEYEINPDDFLSMGKSTPFKGEKVFGKCIATLYKDKFVYGDLKQYK